LLYGGFVRSNDFTPDFGFEKVELTTPTFPGSEIFIIKE
jgi:hypothetical protein